MKIVDSGKFVQEIIEGATVIVLGKIWSIRNKKECIGVGLTEVEAWDDAARRLVPNMNLIPNDSIWYRPDNGGIYSVIRFFASSDSPPIIFIEIRSSKSGKSYFYSFDSFQSRPFERIE
jgi:hypothetical protein